jgi:hypothetical protein
VESADSPNSPCNPCGVRTDSVRNTRGTVKTSLHQSYEGLPFDLETGHIVVKRIIIFFCRGDDHIDENMSALYVLIRIQKLQLVGFRVL